MQITVTQKTETVGGKVYPLTITRQVGLQEILVDGKPMQVTSLTIFESPLGTSRCYTRAQPEVPPEVREANRRRVREIATKAMIDQGIW